jgi:heme-binding protein
MSVIVRSICAAAAIGAVMTGGAAVASAEPPPPNCTAADLAGIMSGVSAATSAYLFTHPDVNGFLTGLKDQPREERRERIREYMDANPQVKAEFEGIRKPSVDFHARCGMVD